MLIDRRLFRGGRARRASNGSRKWLKYERIIGINVAPLAAVMTTRETHPRGMGAAVQQCFHGTLHDGFSSRMARQGYAKWRALGIGLIPSNSGQE